MIFHFFPLPNEALLVRRHFLSVCEHFLNILDAICSIYVKRHGLPCDSLDGDGEGWLPCAKGWIRDSRSFIHTTRNTELGSRFVWVQNVRTIHFYTQTGPRSSPICSCRFWNKTDITSENLGEIMTYYGVLIIISFKDPQR